MIIAPNGQPVWVKYTELDSEGFWIYPQQTKTVYASGYLTDEGGVALPPVGIYRLTPVVVGAEIYGDIGYVYDAVTFSPRLIQIVP